MKLLRRTFSTFRMACSRYEYVKQFELDDKILPNTWIVVRVDGKGFHKFANIHNFEKPNDVRALNLMNYAAVTVMQEFRDIVIGFGQSDEYSFVFRKSTEIYKRRCAKIMSMVTSLFTSAFVLNWTRFFPDNRLHYAPCFDGRIVLYPSDENLRDYLSWRQADVHVNNLYNTAFWNLVLRDNLTNSAAEERLRGTMAAEKNELLFQRFKINYNNEPAIFRKGTVLLRKRVHAEKIDLKRQLIVPQHIDLIKDSFWSENWELLDTKGAGGDVFHLKDKDLPLLMQLQLSGRGHEAGN
ncbi:probable tRNA(His) guanylyltransferase [Phlebotomus argentipes]|uniref:probable tRNA(His) guanylyltransferase n=1 Tax=Phlebotomus argentipes TaxID=94469 RepID=UPI0028937295|nr:probable tRNA(His) guanylyltransferase [Phlebotomus argentipes]